MGLVSALALAQSAADDNGLTAREMFMAARAKAMTKEAPKSAMQAATPHTAKRPDAQVVTPEAPVPEVPVPAVPAPVEPAAVTAPPAERPESPAPPQRDREMLAVPVGYASPTPIGLRYTLIKVTGDRNEDVSADTVFHSGDHMKIAVDVTESGYLYIITQGSSGTWEPLFPTAAVDHGDNRVMAGRSYVVPAGHVFTFTGQPGTEKLFVVFSRQPEQEIDRLVYTLQNHSTEPLAKPVEPNAPAPTFLLSSNKPIDNSVVDKLRDVYSRDLIIEKAEDTDQAKPARQQDKSVYVVSRDGSAGARVVADIQLIHQ